MKERSEIHSVGVESMKRRLPFADKKALTLLEMIIALAMLGIIFSAILPQFRVMFNSWDSKQASAEILQNGRVLIDHLNRNLSQAVCITEVSAPSVAKGTITFQNNAGVTQTYYVKPGNNYVEFGPHGSLQELAGPVSSLQFTCYDACSIPTTDVTQIRFVAVSMTFPNTAALGQSKTFSTQAYIRTNYQEDDSDAGFARASLSFYEYDTQDGKTPALCQIDSTHYLCAYEGKDGDGWVVVLEVNPSTWNVTKKTPFEFDIQDCKSPALIQIDSTHYLCAYTGNDDKGWAVVLEVNPSTWNITAKTPFEFDNNQGSNPALAQIDSTHYLCAYQGKDDDGWAVVLEVSALSWDITVRASFEWDADKGEEPALAKINNTRYLCAYRGPSDDGWTIVLMVNPGNYAISTLSSFEFDSQECGAPALVKIDDNHYLCAYGGTNSDGWVVVLNVATGSYVISRGMPFEYDTVNGETPSLIWIKDYDYLCAYAGNGDKGNIIGLRIATDSWNVSAVNFYQFDNNQGEVPALVRIDDLYCICAYQGSGDDGWAGVIRYGVPIAP